MWLPLVGLGLGVVLGLVLNVSVSPELARYTAVAILAGLDSVLGAVRAELDGHFHRVGLARNQAGDHAGEGIVHLGFGVVGADAMQRMRFDPVLGVCGLESHRCQGVLRQRTGHRHVHADLFGRRRAVMSKIAQRQISCGGPR